MSVSDNDSLQEPNNVIGYWMSEKKSQKLNWMEFSSVCRKNGYKLVKLNLDIPLEGQGPFTAIVHKLTDIIVKSFQNDEKAIKMINRVEEYLDKNKEIAVLDPLPNVKKLLDRYCSYRAISDSNLHKYGVFTPSFVELTSDDVSINLLKLKKAGVTFPLICKTSVAQGTKECHTMAVIFNESGIKDCKPPCVAQSFINHNAILYKVYILGEQYDITERPSLKNFYPSDHETIFFDSHKVSKPDSTSSLSILDPHEADQQHQQVLLNPDKVKAIVQMLRNIFGMSLLGIDIVIENNTGRYAIIDINAYPGYDGYPNFFEDLMVCIEKTIENHQNQLSIVRSSSDSPRLRRKKIVNISSLEHKNRYNGIVIENGQLERIDNLEDIDDDLLNSNNKHRNNNCNDKNIYGVNNDQCCVDKLTNSSSVLCNEVDDDKKCVQLQQLPHNNQPLQRVRTAVSGKKSVERQL